MRSNNEMEYKTISGGRLIIFSVSGRVCTHPSPTSRSQLKNLDCVSKLD
ncbi:8514_t:CDS:1, partial [Racocetra fulgida]